MFMVSFYVSTTFVEVNHCRQALNEVMAFGSPFLKNKELTTAEKKKNKTKQNMLAFIGPGVPIKKAGCVTC